MKNYDKEFEDIVSSNFSDSYSKSTDPREDRFLKGAIKWINYDDLTNEEEPLSDSELDFYTVQENLINYLVNEYKITPEEAKSIYSEFEEKMYPTIQDVE